MLETMLMLFDYYLCEKHPKNIHLQIFMCIILIDIKRSGLMFSLQQQFFNESYWLFQTWMS